MQTHGLYKPCQDAVLLLGAVLIVWRAEFLRDDTIHSKWTKAVITNLQCVRWKGTIGASLKHFESDCFITEGVYAFDTTYECREVSKTSFKTQAQDGPGVLSIGLIWDECCKPTVLYLGPFEDKTIAENV